MDSTLAVVLAIAVVGFGLVLGGMENQRRRTDRRIARTERRLDQALSHLGIDDSDPRLQEVRELALSGKKIKAIKRYREVTGADLVEAKEAVERIPGVPR
ncbi:ribosomal protein L7/L12 [Streptomyces sp. NPDC054796]